MTGALTRDGRLTGPMGTAFIFVLAAACWVLVLIAALMVLG